MRGNTDSEPGAALRAHLLDTVERLVAERPIASITTREVARAADVSTGVLYNYFTDKNDLVVAALSRRLDSLVDHCIAALPVAGTATLAEDLAGCARAVRTGIGEAFTLVAGVFGQPDLMHRLFAATHAEAQPAARFMAALTGYVTAEQRLGRIRPDLEAPAVVALLAGACLTMTLSSLLTPASPAQIEEDVAHVVDMVLTGIRSPA